MNTEEFNKAVKPLSDKWTEDLVTHPAQITKNNQLDEDILELCKGTDDAIREKIIKYIESNNQVPEKIQSLAEDILKLHRPDPQYSYHESSCRKCNSTEIDTVVAKQKEEIDKLKKELDNSKFGAQCSVHELEYDKKTLIKENEKLTNLLNEVIGLADLMSDEINKNWCKESKLAVGKLNSIIEKSGWIRP